MILILEGGGERTFIVGPRRVGLRRVGPCRVDPKGWGGPKFRAFFSLSHHNVHSFFTLLGVFTWNFGGVFLAPGPSSVHVWSSRVVV